MPRLTVTITDEQESLIEEKSSDDGEYESKSEAVRNLIDRGERVDELETELERVHREKQQLLEQRDENDTLARYVEDELSYREAPLTTRLKWWIYGRNGE